MDNCTTAQQGGWTLCGECLTAGCTPCPPAQGEWPGRRPEGDYDCQRTAPAVHIHVGHNVPGYLPESDIMCFDSVEGALEALRHEIKDQQDYYAQGCEASNFVEDCECAWCSVALDCEAALSAIADGDAAHVLRTQDVAAWIFSPPEGADVHHWAIKVADLRDDCEIFADQES
jgi:hypothetical protein